MKKKKKKEIRFIIPVLLRQQQKLGRLKKFPDDTVCQRECGSGKRPACCLTVFLPGMEFRGRWGPRGNLAWLTYNAAFIAAEQNSDSGIHTYTFLF